MHTIKPLDREAVVRAAMETKAIVTAEEHNVIGGLGSAVAEALVETVPVVQEMVGVKDTFGESGAPSELLEKYGLTAKDIVAAVKKVIERKTKLNR
jgi:transketolase